MVKKGIYILYDVNEQNVVLCVKLGFSCRFKKKTTAREHVHKANNFFLNMVNA